MRRIIMLVTLALVMAAMMLASALPAFAVPGDSFPPEGGEGPSVNASDGLTMAQRKSTKSKGVSDIVIIKKLDKVSPILT
jgi:hypothetical protein